MPAPAPAPSPASPADPTGSHRSPDPQGVLIFEWRRDDQCVRVEHVDGMIDSWPASEAEAMETAAKVFGPDRSPHVLDDGTTLRWTHFAVGG